MRALVRCALTPAATVAVAVRLTSRTHSTLHDEQQEQQSPSPLRDAAQRTRSRRPRPRRHASHTPRQQRQGTTTTTTATVSNNSDDHTTAAPPPRLPQSYDVSERDDAHDVERHFATAMSHLKATVRIGHVADDVAARAWHDITHERDVDGHYHRHRDASDVTAEGRSSRVHSFFDEGGVDIRHAHRHHATAAATSTAAKAAATPPPPDALDDADRRDILQLTGGTVKRDGLAVTTHSNSAPADQTLEDSYDDDDLRGRRAFGDTPTQLTDMLRERLAELKASKLRQERNETYMPRRLHLLSDAELQQQQQRRRQLADASCATAQRRTNTESTVASRPTLASLHDNNDDDDAHNDAHDEDGGSRRRRDAAQRDIVRDGYDAERVRRAARMLAGAAPYTAHGRMSAAAATARSRGVATATRADAAGGSNSSNTAAVDAELALSRRLHSTLERGGDEDGSDDADKLQQRSSDAHASTSPPTASGADDADDASSVYLLRVLPRAGYCSRREAVTVIAAGHVRVNNVVVRDPFRRVRAEDDVMVDGHAGRLRFAPPRLWMYHKPSYVVSSRNDPLGRALITRHARILGFDHLVPVGSLPMRAHGVLLLTNDGELAQVLQSPAAMLQRTYQLRVRPAIDAVLAHKLNTHGININGRQLRHVEFLVNAPTAASGQSRYAVKVKVRGETMPIAHLMQHLGRTIVRGGRVSYGPFAIGRLAVGSLREVTVPPLYAEHLGAVWRSFVERDWPYFRRRRVARLRALSRHRELTPKEVDELDHFTYDELHEALTFKASELTRTAAQMAAALSRRPVVHEPPLAYDFAPPRTAATTTTAAAAASAGAAGAYMDNDSSDIAVDNWTSDDDAIFTDVTAIPDEAV